MVPEKRNILAICGALAVAFALPGCAPAGYNPADYGGAADAQPAANAARVEASPTATAEAEAEAEKQNAPELTDEELTNELIASEIPKMGAAVVDEDGWILYRFEADNNKPAKSNCEGDCEKAWPPALTDGDPKLDGISADIVGTVQRPDGTRQLTLDGWPIYRYAKDEKPGQWKGQGVGGKWFVVAPDGKRNEECLPPGVKPPAAGGAEKDDKAEVEGEDKNAPSDKGAGDAGGGEYNY